MPHLHIKEFKAIEFPSHSDGVDFNFLVKNSNNTNEQMISVKVEEDEFFLLLNQDENNHVARRAT